MGRVWAVFRVSLTVLGAIVFTSVVLVATVTGAMWLFSSQKACHETIGAGACIDFIVVQGLIESNEKFRFRNVTENTEIAMLTTAYAGSTGAPTVKYTIVMRANPRPDSDTADPNGSPKKPKEDIEKAFAEAMRRRVCKPSQVALFKGDAPNLQSFLKVGGVIEFDLGVSRATLDRQHSGDLMSDLTENKELNRELKAALARFHYTLGPITITSCEDKP
jgi:hypothetical protein